MTKSNTRSGGWKTNANGLTKLAAADRLGASGATLLYKRYFDDYPLWVAHYLQPHQPRISRDWAFWQHSEQGHVNGIFSKVDFDVFNGDSTAFKALLVP